MNATIQSMMVLAAMFGVSASAQVPSCRSSLSIGDVVAAMGGDIRAQPVFSGGGLKGWRTYKTSTSEQLMAQGIGEGSLMTHVCGVPAREIFVKGGNICCNSDASREFEVVFELAGNQTKFLVRRP